MKKAGGGPAPTKAGPTKQQLDALAAAQSQLVQKNWSDCMGTIIAAMAESEFAAAKLVLAQCEDQGGLILEASGDAKLAQKYAEEEVNTEVKKKADDLVARLANDTPTIVVVVPKTIDKSRSRSTASSSPRTRPTSPSRTTRARPRLRSAARRAPYPYNFKSTESFDRGERITVNADRRQVEQQRRLAVHPQRAHALGRQHAASRPAARAAASPSAAVSRSRRTTTTATSTSSRRRCSSRPRTPRPAGASAAATRSTSSPTPRPTSSPPRPAASTRSATPARSRPR